MPLSRSIPRLALLALATLPCPVLAQATKGNDIVAAIGAGTVISPVYEGADRFRIIPIPVISFAYKDVIAVQGLEARVSPVKLDLGGDALLRLGAMARFRFGRDESDDPDLKGLGDIGASAEVGGFARIERRRAWVQLGVGKDVANGHKGVVAELEGGIGFRLTPRLGASLSATAGWADDRYMQRNFGIDAAQATASGLPRFEAKAGLKHVGATLTLNRRLGTRWAAGLTSGYRRLLGDAAGSPMVRDRGTPDQLFGLAFLSYRL